jgi:AraC-like DNA-binding protein/mannose-6-phosphate isomerase-like protein (cupin superfamily)
MRWTPGMVELTTIPVKAIIEHLPALAAKDAVACEVVRGSNFGCRWHFHPELELLLTLRGGTHRWIGDNISPLEPGDLVLIGSNLPHDFRNDRSAGIPFRPVHAIVLQFRPDLLGAGWLERNDMTRVQRLFQLAAHGLEITGQTRKRVAQLLKRAPQARGLQRLILTLQILALLSSSRELRRIGSPGFSPELQVADHDRMAAISAFVAERLAEPIYLKQVARHAGMSEASLSRYFRSRTGKTFPAYLNELRVARVCRLLAETDATVTEIALACGFDSMANFDHQFSRLHGCSPKVYRQKALRISVADPAMALAAS